MQTIRRIAITLAVGLATPLTTQALDIKAITEKPRADNPQFENKEAWSLAGTVSRPGSGTADGR